VRHTQGIANPPASPARHKVLQRVHRRVNSRREGNSQLSTGT
jgi:hypothetical protein